MGKKERRVSRHLFPTRRAGRRRPTSSHGRSVDPRRPFSQRMPADPVGLWSALWDAGTGTGPARGMLRPRALRCCWSIGDRTRTPPTARQPHRSLCYCAVPPFCLLPASPLQTQPRPGIPSQHNHGQCASIYLHFIDWFGGRSDRGFDRGRVPRQSQTAAAARMHMMIPTRPASCLTLF